VAANLEKTHQIAYCGLYCGDCHGFKGTIPNLARDLRKELRAANYKTFADALAREEFGRVLRDYDKCYAVLGAMARFRCKKGCRNGGGPPFCKIRACAIKKALKGCWECEEFEACQKLSFLKAVHADGHIKNLRILKKKGPKAFLAGKRYW
jgi:hypothetical protein